MPSPGSVCTPSSVSGWTERFEIGGKSRRVASFKYVVLKEVYIPHSYIDYIFIKKKTTMHAGLKTLLYRFCQKTYNIYMCQISA